jgi:hypothetical protein
MGMDLNWQTGNSFTPLDAIGQWLKQGMHKNNHTLEQVLLRWLATNNPDRQISIVALWLVHLLEE